MKNTPKQIISKHATASVHIFHKNQEILCFPSKGTARHPIRKKNNQCCRFAVLKIQNFPGKWHART